MVEGTMKEYWPEAVETFVASTLTGVKALGLPSSREIWPKVATVGAVHEMTAFWPMDHV